MPDNNKNTPEPPSGKNQERNDQTADEKRAGDYLSWRRKKLTEAEMRKRMSIEQRWAKIFSFSPSMEFYQALELLMDGAKLMSIQGERPVVQLNNSSCYLPAKHARFLIKHHIVEPIEYKTTTRKGIDRKMAVYHLNEKSIYYELYDVQKHNKKIMESVVNEFKEDMKEFLRSRRRQSAHSKAKRTKLIKNPNKLHPQSKNMIES